MCFQLAQFQAKSLEDFLGAFHTDHNINNDTA